jgi:hypothetical protein
MEREKGGWRVEGRGYRAICARIDGGTDVGYVGEGEEEEGRMGMLAG